MWLACSIFIQNTIHFYFIYDQYISHLLHQICSKYSPLLYQIRNKMFYSYSKCIYIHTVLYQIQPFIVTKCSVIILNTLSIYTNNIINNKILIRTSFSSRTSRLIIFVVSRILLVCFFDILPFHYMLRNGRGFIINFCYCTS